jgi:hypothetical protein
MPFITKSNLDSILKKIDYNKITVTDEGIYHKKIFILGTREKKEILGLKLLLEDTENFILDYYDAYITTDNLQFVYEGSVPAYHCDYQCEKLSSQYKNFRIPEIIKERAKEKGGEELVEKEVKNFRKWFNENKDILESDPQLFLNRLADSWHVDVPLSEIERKNSGIEYVENIDLRRLENIIDNILNAASKFYNGSTEEKKKILRRLGTAAYYHSKASIEIDREYLETLSESEVKDFLKEYERKIKIPLRQTLKDYHRVKINPNLTFEGLLLDKLNFKKCGICYKNGEPQIINEPPLPTYSSYSVETYNKGWGDTPFPTMEDYREYRI